MSLTKFSLYDISISHPRSWNVYSNPKNNLSYKHGMLKVECAEDKLSAVSMTLRWWMTEMFNINAYTENLHTELKKKFKNKVQNYRAEATQIADHKAVFSNFSYLENHSIYKVLRNDEAISEMQILTFCPVSSRVVVANIAAMTENMCQNSSTFQALLSGMTCH